MIVEMVFFFSIRYIFFLTNHFSVIELIAGYGLTILLLAFCLWLNTVFNRLMESELWVLRLLSLDVVLFILRSELTRRRSIQFPTSFTVEDEAIRRLQ